MNSHLALDDLIGYVVKDRRHGIGQPPNQAPWPRTSARITLNAEVTLRRSGHSNFRVTVRDASSHDCKIDFVEKPRPDDRVWVKIDGLEALEGSVCWVDGIIGEVEFEKPVHPAVCGMLVADRK